MDQKYLIKISYDGTRYCGWQVQPNGVSIQGSVETALQTLLKTPIRVIGAGRTDAGVHAKGQVAHFSCSQVIAGDQLLNALNGLLPYDIRIKALLPTSEDFHAQYAALSKEYHYHLWVEKTIDPFFRLYRHHFFRQNFSISQLKEAAALFVGTHDFATFANMGGNVCSTTRRLSRLDITEQEGGFRLEFEGDGFLYKMVRNIVGTLLDTAIGKLKSPIQKLFAAKDRRWAGPAAPPRGLFLMKINYPAKFLNSSGKELK